ncbi:hypothetical protein [Pedobacter sp. UBA4863]|nr:hypothetical protein [Pedobacter sp. UBA4863]
MAFFYLAVASGAGVNLHYCMGELADWSLIQDKKHACDFCGMEKKGSAKNGCCKDVQHLAKVDQAQQTNVQIYKFEQSVFVVPTLKPTENYLLPVTKVISQEARSNAPPLGQLTPIFIKNCTYRI